MGLVKETVQTQSNGYEADVCLLLEGTYPYVPGGVSTWVHHLVSALKEVTFCGVVILPSLKQEWRLRYDLPPNFKHLEHVYIHDYELSPSRRRFGRRRKAVKILEEFHRALRKGRPEALDDLLPLLYPPPRRPLSIEDMIYSKPAWDMLLRLYEPHENEESFIDYFWTRRFSHLPIYQILDAPMPRARVYHAISTGYAGLLGVLAARRRRRPLLLTEHGIYTKERKIEIAQAEWIYLANREEIRVQKELGAFQRLWIRIFEGISRLTYYVASEVITLYEGNRQTQIAEGCPPDKTRIIPNGIRIERFTDLKGGSFGRGEIFKVGFVGRVVPIKDVKTFLRACKLVSLRDPKASFYVVGPTDEDEEYYRECLALTETLGLKDKVTYTGRVDTEDCYGQLDLICLTSVSEAQPLVVLEANCAGIPVVASDVGACAELLHGRTPADRALGPSGLITGLADPSGTAEAILSLMHNEDLRRQMVEAGRERVRRYYQEERLNQRYQELYAKYAGVEP